MTWWVTQLPTLVIGVGIGVILMYIKAWHSRRENEREEERKQEDALQLTAEEFEILGVVIDNPAASKPSDCWLVNNESNTFVQAGGVAYKEPPGRTLMVATVEGLHKRGLLRAFAERPNSKQFRATHLGEKAHAAAKAEGEKD